MMIRGSITQDYYALVINKSGVMPAMKRDESIAGLVVAGIMDMVLNDIISLDKRIVTINCELPMALQYLESLYNYLKAQKRPKLNRVLEKYLFSGSKVRQLIFDVGKSLFAENLVTMGKGGIFGNNVLFIPKVHYKNELINTIKTKMYEEDNFSEQDIALLFILSKTHNLKQYFSRDEYIVMKAQLKAIKKNPVNSEYIKTISYVNDIAACMVILSADII